MQHVLILHCTCMYVPTVCQSRLGPGAYQVTSYASAARVSHGYMVCARARVAWLHGLPIALALPRVTGSASFSAVEFLEIIIIYIYIYIYIFIYLFLFLSPLCHQVTSTAIEQELIQAHVHAPPTMQYRSSPPNVTRCCTTLIIMHTLTN